MRPGNSPRPTPVTDQKLCPVHHSPIVMSGRRPRINPQNLNPSTPVQSPATNAKPAIPHPIHPHPYLPAKISIHSPHASTPDSHPEPSRRPSARSIPPAQPRHRKPIVTTQLPSPQPSATLPHFPQLFRPHSTTTHPTNSRPQSNFQTPFHRQRTRRRIRQ